MSTEAAGAPLVSAPRLSFGAKAIFGVGDFGANLIYQCMSLVLMFFYTDVMRLDPAVAGLVFSGAVVLDGFVDPMVGILADRTKTRWGKFRPYLIFGAPLLALTFWATFHAPPLTGVAMGVYAFATHFAVRVMYSAITIPFGALAARVSLDPDERSAIASYRMQGAGLAGLAAAGSIDVARFLGSGDLALGFSLTAAAFGLVGLVCLWLTAARAAEPQGMDGWMEKKRPEKEGFFHEFFRDIGEVASLLQRNKPLRQMFLVIMVAMLSLVSSQSATSYYFKYALNDIGSVALALAMTPILLILSAPVWSALSKVLGKLVVWQIGVVLAVAGVLFIFFMPGYDTTVTLIGLGLAGLGNSALFVMFWSMIPDTIEYSEWLGEERNEGKVFGFATFAQKAALGATGLMFGGALAIAGFAPDVAQPPSTLLAIKALLCLPMAIGGVLTIFIMRGYPITAAFHRQIVAEIAERRARAIATRS